jgi:DMSO/TMAO reductase YedYZ molybdopterin-dependent catalytic subunit
MTNVKWLARITLLDEPFAGYQQRHSYRVRTDDEEEGRPLTRMLPRALLIPPGIPEFPSRERTLPPGPCLLEGRAWSGFGVIADVKVSTDGGASWHEAELHAPVSPSAWHRWSYRWQPPGPGVYELRCRARDALGNVQPDEPTWNVGGYANNAVQRVPVTVTP